MDAKLVATLRQAAEGRLETPLVWGVWMYDWAQAAQRMVVYRKVLGRWEFQHEIDRQTLFMENPEDLWVGWDMAQGSTPTLPAHLPSRIGRMMGEPVGENGPWDEDQNQYWDTTRWETGKPVESMEKLINRRYIELVKMLGENQGLKYMKPGEGIKQQVDPQQGMTHAPQPEPQPLTKEQRETHERLTKEWSGNWPR